MEHSASLSRTARHCDSCITLDQWFVDWHSVVTAFLDEISSFPRPSFHAADIKVEICPGHCDAVTIFLSDSQKILPTRACRVHADGGEDPWLEPVDADPQAGHLPGHPVVPLRLQPEWIQSLMNVWHENMPWSDDEGQQILKVRSWYLNPHRFLKWSSWRALRFSSNTDAWAHVVRDVWGDILDDSPVSFHLATPPAPLGLGEHEYVADLILTQHAAPPWKANLYALVFTGQRPTVHTEAHLVYSMVSKWTIIYTFGADRFCGGPAWLVSFHRLCEVYHGYHKVTAELEHTEHGHAYVLEVHPPVYMPAIAQPGDGINVANAVDSDDDDEVAFIVQSPVHSLVAAKHDQEHDSAQAAMTRFQFHTRLRSSCRLRWEYLHSRSLSSSDTVPQGFVTEIPEYCIRLWQRLTSASIDDSAMSFRIQIWCLTETNGYSTDASKFIELSSDVSQWSSQFRDACPMYDDFALVDDAVLVTPDLPCSTAFQIDASVIFSHKVQHIRRVVIGVLVQNDSCAFIYELAIALFGPITGNCILDRLPVLLRPHDQVFQIWNGLVPVALDTSVDLADGSGLLVVIGEFDMTKFQFQQKIRFLVPDPHDPSPFLPEVSWSDEVSLVQTLPADRYPFKKLRDEAGDLPWNRPDPPHDQDARASPNEGTPPADAPSSSDDFQDRVPSNDGEGNSPSPSERGPAPPPVIGPPTNVPAHMQNVMLLRIAHDPILAVISWDQYDSMMREVAGHYGQDMSTLLATHEVHTRLPGAPDGVAVLIVQFVRDLAPGSDYQMCVVDLEIHESEAQVAFPTWRRLVVPLPPRLARVQLLRILRLQVYCSVENHRCLVYHDLQNWPFQDLAVRPVSHGMYFRVIVPPSTLSLQTTSCLIASRNVGTPDDGMDPLMAHVLGIPTNEHAPAPEEEDSVPVPNEVDDSILMQQFISLRTASEAQLLASHDLKAWATTSHVAIPGVFPVHVWFIHPQLQPCCEVPRLTWLTLDEATWVQHLLFTWRDVAEPDSCSFSMLQPQPWESADGDPVHVLMWQKVPGNKAAVLASVYDSLYNGGSPFRHAHLAHRPSTTEDLLLASGLAGRCADKERVDCSVWWGTIELPEGSSFPVQSAHAFNYVVQHLNIQNDRWEEESEAPAVDSTRQPDSDPSCVLPLSPISSSGLLAAGTHVPTHVDDTQVPDHADSLFGLSLDDSLSLVQREVSLPFPNYEEVLAPVAQSGGGLHEYVDEYVDCSSCATPAGSAPVIGQAPFFLWSLYQCRASLQSSDHWDAFSSVPISTWFLNFKHNRVCTQSRPVLLGPVWADWPRQMQTAWSSEIDPSAQLDFHVVNPPVVTEGRLSVHVILIQHAIMHEKAVLAAIRDHRTPAARTDFRALVQNFAMTPESLLLGCGIFSDCFIADCPTRCEVFAESCLLPWGYSYYPSNGQLLEVHLGDSQDESDASQFDGLSFLQTLVHRVQIARKPSTLPFPSFSASGQGLCPGQPVQIQLDQPDWRACLTQRWPLAMIPPGLDIPPATWEALHAQWSVPAYPPQWLELYIDGSYGVSGSGWAVVVVADHDCAVQKNQTMGQLIAALSSQYPFGGQVWEVRAHLDDPWNELADRLAKHAATNCASVGHVYWHLLHGLAQNPTDRQWMWLQTAPPHLQSAYPKLYQGQVWQPAPVTQSVHPQLDTPECPDLQMTLHFSLATFNALALGSDQEGQHRSLRAIRLSQQFSNKHLALVGLQEARTEQGVHVTDDYLVYSSGRSQTGRATHHGCELWVHRRLTLATSDDSRVPLASLKVVVIHADPRRMLVSFSGAVNFLVLVAHAPCVSSATSIDEYQKWWDDTLSILHPARGHGPLIALLDANAPLASEDTPFYGLHFAEPMNPQGHVFQDALASLDLAVPATMGFHTGPAHTWQHPGGTRLRRDYVAISREWLSLVHTTRTMLDIDSGFQHEDHLPCLCSLHGHVVANYSKTQPSWDHAKFKDPSCIHNFQAALASLPVPAWTTAIDDHVALTEQQVLRIAKQSFARTEAKKRQRPVLQPATLELIALKRQVLDWMRHSPADIANGLKVQLKELERDIRPLVRRDQQDWYAAWIDELQESADRHDSKKLFSMLTRLGRKKKGQPKGPKPLPTLKKQDGSPAQDIAECQETWRTHFAKVEAGLQMSEEELAEVHLSVKPLPMDLIDLDMVPSLWEVQTAMSRVKPGKAAGPNGLLPELFKIGGLPLASHLHVMMVKASIECKEPLKWKGGNLIPLWKGKGTMALPENFRAIFVSNVSAKLYHSCIRSRLESLWLSRIDSLQQGGRKGLGTDLSHHVLQSLSAWGRSQGVSTAVLFVDLHSAFYSVIRTSLFQDATDVSFLRQAFDRFHITPQDFAEILEVTSADHALEGLSAHGQHMLLDFFSAAFFQMHSTEGLTMTTRGTRPGDPLGDLLFNMVFQLVMRQARVSFLQATQTPWVGDPVCPDDFTAVPVLPSAFHFQMAFVDDLACAIAMPGTAQLMSSLACMTSCLHDAARQRGLELNYSAGKTEAMVCPAGSGSRQLRTALWRDMHAVWPVVVEHGLLSLRVVQSYKHLGTHLQDKAITTKDRGLRLATARQAFGPLSKSFFRKRNVSLQTKCRVFDSLVSSRHLYNVHVWSWITDRELQLWATGLRTQVAAMVKPKLKGLPLQSFSTDDLYGLLGAAAPLDVLHANRLRYLARVLRSGPLLLWQLLKAHPSDTAWLHALQTSFQWLRTFSTRISWPSPDDLDSWFMVAQLNKKWRGTISAALKSSIQFRQQIALAKVWEKDIERTLHRQGVLPMAVQDATDKQWQCGQCDKSFETTRGLAMHCSKVHGYRPWAKHYMIGSTCLACGTDFDTRPRAIIHLSGRFSCAATYRACFPPLSDERVAELDAADCELARDMAQQGWGRTKALLPAVRLPLPLLPLPHSDEARIMHAFWVERQPADPQGLHSLHGWRNVSPDPDAVSSSPHADEDDIIPFVGNSPAGRLEGSVGQFQSQGLSLTTVRVFLTAKVFVHFYSGHRREGDLQWMIENQWWAGDVVCFCLSVDLCLEKQRSDMSRHDNIQFWRSRMLAGQILGVGGGPSCETWTAARLQAGGPRPVRSHRFPWGNPGLSKREWDQVIIGTTLLRVLVDFLLLGAQLGLCGFLEHPAYPVWAMTKKPCSIWSLQIFRHLSKLQCVSITTFDQCTLGLPAKKPTCMLLLRLPDTRRVLLSHGHQGRCHHGHSHIQLKGRDEKGAFRTSVAKIYPPELNKALAVGILRFAALSDSPEGTAVDELPAEFLPLLSRDFVDTNVVQPD